LLIGGLVRENDDFDSRGAGLMEPLIPDSRSAGTNNLELVFMMRPRVIVYTSGEEQRQKAYADSKNVKDPSVALSERTDWLKSSAQRPYTTTREEPIESEALEAELVYDPIVTPVVKPVVKQKPMVITPPEPEVVIPEIVVIEQPVIEPVLEEVIIEPVLEEPVVVVPELAADVTPAPEIISYEPPNFDELDGPVDVIAAEVVEFEGAVTQEISLEPIVDSVLQDVVEESDVPVLEVFDVEAPMGRVSPSVDVGAGEYIPSSSGSRISKGINQYGSEYAPE
jgi:hypothetical protein